MTEIETSKLRCVAGFELGNGLPLYSFNFPSSGKFVYMYNFTGILTIVRLCLDIFYTNLEKPFTVFKLPKQLTHSERHLVSSSAVIKTVHSVCIMLEYTAKL